MAAKVTKNNKKENAKVKQAFEQIVKSSDKVDNAIDDAVGVDIGTSKIVVATRNNNKDLITSQLNAFIAVDYSKFTEGILKQNEISHSKMGESLIVYGDGAEIFANMLNTETRRPMQKGLLNPKEENAIEIIKGIINDVVVSPDAPESPLCFSIPDVNEDLNADIIYHETILKRHLDEKGYKSKSINEGMAVVFSELEKDNFTGFGISAGGGMCNVCLSYLSIPHISFSITKGGDYIDNAAASVTGEVSTRVRDIKETKLDLTKKPTNDIEEALHVYYDDLIITLVNAIKSSIAQTSKFPKVESPIPIVLSGGTAKPIGFQKRFEMFLKKDGFPLEISEVRMAEDPLTATAKGALIAAMYEG